MATVTIRGITKQFGTQIVLEDVSLELHAGETAGLVGPNGAGKTTIFRLIGGEMEPDNGTIIRAKSLEIGYLKQEPDIVPDRSLYDEVGSAFADLLELEKQLHALAERIAAEKESNLSEIMAQYDRVNTRFIAAGGHGFETKLHECLGGLGFSQADYLLPMSVLSGGQKCRAALARVLLQDRQLLLLDEPTNHLDIDAVRWLEQFLANHRGGAVVISHDRYLLDRVCTRILEIEHRQVLSFPGNYTNYAQTKEVRIKTQQREFEKDSAFVAKERAFIAKHLAGQRTKEAQGRRKRLERRLKAGEFTTEDVKARHQTKIAFGEATAGQGVTLRVDELSMAFGENRLFEGLTFQVQASQRLGITGPNGSGKSTLLKIVLGQFAPTSGEVTLDPKRSVGYYAQEAVELDPHRTVLEEIRAARPELGEQQARAYLGRYHFTQNEVFKTLGLLSGGEQSRVRLAALILSNPDVLILDEPTNHLDIASREALENALAEYGGTIIAVSHDRYFLDRIVDRLLVIRPTGSKVYAGNYSYYVEQVEQETVARRTAKTESAKRVKKSRGDKPILKKPTSPYDGMSVDELETLIMEHETKLFELQERFGDSAVYKDADGLAELQEETERVSQALHQLNEAWRNRVDGL